MSNRVEKDYNDLFDGDDTSNVGDCLNDNAVKTHSFSKGIVNDEEDDDDIAAVDEDDDLDDYDVNVDEEEEE